MNKKIFALAVMIWGLGSLLFAVSFEEGGYTVLAREVEEGKDVYLLEDAGGFPFAVVLSGELRPNQLERLRVLTDVFRSLRQIPIASLRVAFTREGAEIILVPRAFSHQGQELSAFMPSGMQFYFDDYLEYDFRMKAENLFFRIRGQFFSEEEFLDRVAEAARDPYLFLQTNDPQFVFRKLLELEKKIDNYAVQGWEALTTLTEDLAALAGDLAAQKAELSAELADTRTALEERMGELAAETAELEGEFMFLRYALLVLHNRGFFGSIRLPSEKGIARLVELKKEEPGLSKEDALVRLRSEGIEMSSKEVFLVFSVYFNEFQ